MIHGDLKGVRDYSRRFITILIPGQSNILVDAEGHARITDFRLATVSSGIDSAQTTSDQSVEGHQQSAAEVLENGTISKEADIFLFAIVMIEVCHRSCSICTTLANCCFCRYRY